MFALPTITRLDETIDGRTGETILHILVKIVLAHHTVDSVVVKTQDLILVMNSDEIPTCIVRDSAMAVAHLTTS